MLRGINKQIIEIKCPNNECFEKILLFVKAQNTNISNRILHDRAEDYYSTVMESYGKIPFYRQGWFKRLLLGFVILGGILTVGWILFS